MNTAAQMAEEGAQKVRAAKRRFRPTTAEGETLKTENATLRAQLKDVRDRAWKWNGVVAFVSFLIGGVLGKAFL